MVTTATPIERPEREERVEQAARLLIAGHEAGAVRRIVLYAIVAAALAATYSVAGVVGLVALVLLAMSDQLA